MLEVQLINEEENDNNKIIQKCTLKMYIFFIKFEIFKYLKYVKIYL